MTDSIKVFPSRTELAESAAQLILDIMHDRLQSSERFTFALSGGSTPRAVFTALAGSGFPDWQKVQFFWSDERTVPPSHPDSNYKMAYDSLLQHITVADGQIHRMRGDAAPDSAAVEYEKTLRASFDTPLPVFDLVLLGMGDDGHTASLFPGTPAVDEVTKLVTAVFVSKLNTWRLTLTYPVINSARFVIFIVAGAAKAEKVALIHNQHSKTKDVPASLVQPDKGALFWLLDDAAASMLKSQNR